MKIFKKGSKSYIMMSRREWEVIGKAFEVREAYSDRQNKLIKEGSAKHPGRYLPLDELLRRLRVLGFEVDLSKLSGHVWLCKYKREPLRPNISLSISAKNDKYENFHVWDEVYKDFRRYWSDLADVLYAPDFRIPDNFDLRTMEYEKEEPVYEEKRVSFGQLPMGELTKMDGKYEIRTDKGWVSNVVDFDYSTNTLMFEDGNLVQYPSLSSPILVRKRV